MLFVINSEKNSKYFVCLKRVGSLPAPRMTCRSFAAARSVRARRDARGRHKAIAFVVPGEGRDLPAAIHAHQQELVHTGGGKAVAQQDTGFAIEADALGDIAEDVGR